MPLPPLVKSSTLEKALAGTLNLIMGRMVSTIGADGIKYYGIVCDSSSFKEQQRKSGVWAIWETTQEEALESYENSTDALLIPGTDGGKLSYLTINEEFEILDEEINERA